jgi:ABC-type multidrug transport system ATPase subunit
MITITNLTKTYSGNIQALHHINLEIGPGMFGLLGPNGAGKTTLMRIIAGLLTPNSGRVSVYGHELAGAGKRAVQAMLGYLPQELNMYPHLSAREFLDYIGILKGINDARARRFQVDELLELVRLNEAGNRLLKTFSGGMKRRVGIAQALLGNPRLLIVDEPTVGLDPEERVRIRNLLADISVRGIVLLSTHVIEDIGHSCADLAILHQGQVLFHGQPGDLIERARGQVWSIRTQDGPPDETLRVVSTLQLKDSTQYRVLGQPAPEYHAQELEPGLEDGYMLMMKDAVSE